jgi:hypothetical protein
MFKAQSLRTKLRVINPVVLFALVVMGAVALQASSRCHDGRRLNPASRPDEHCFFDVLLYRAPALDVLRQIWYWGRAYFSVEIR